MSRLRYGARYQGGRRPMTRYDWWLGVVLLTLAILTHAAIPRYELITDPGGFMRFDRWTGRVELRGKQNIATAPWINAPR